MYFTPDVEDEVIREAFSHKLYIPLFNPSNKFWRDSTKKKTPPSPFQIGESLWYHNEGHNEIVDMVDININDHNSTKYSIKLLRRKTMIVTNEFLK